MAVTPNSLDNNGGGDDVTLNNASPTPNTLLQPFS
jgi:hypothetical protein